MLSQAAAAVRTGLYLYYFPAHGCIFTGTA
jgi:hypothetical protein